MSEKTIGGLTVAQISTAPEGDTTWVRTGPDTVLPGRVVARFVITDPAIEVAMRVHVDGSGRPAIRHIEIDCEPRVNVSISLMRSLPVDAMMREALDQSIVHRPDPGAGESSEYVRGRPVSGNRVERVAEVYRLALAGGSSAPTKVVMATLGYSNATASRDVRRARKLGLIPSLVDLGLPGSEAPRKAAS